VDGVNLSRREMRVVAELAPVARLPALALGSRLRLGVGAVQELLEDLELKGVVDLSVDRVVYARLTEVGRSALVRSVRASSPFERWTEVFSSAANTR